MKNLILLTITLCTISLNVYASGAGTSAGQTLLEPVSARMTALAQAGVSLNGTSEVMMYNPAGLQNLTGKEAIATYRRGFDDDTYATGVYAKDLKNLRGALAIQYYSTGEIDLYDSSGNKISKIGQRDIIITLGASKILKGYPVGVNFKMISSNIFGEKAAGFGLDVGAQYPKITKGIDFGFAIRNIGTKLKFIDEGDSLPANIAAGASYKKNLENGYLNTTLEIPYYLNESMTLALIGAEYSYQGLGEIRMGYRINLSDSNAEASAFQIGLGFGWKNYRLDYSMGLAVDLNNPHNISLKLKL